MTYWWENAIRRAMKIYPDIPGGVGERVKAAIDFTFAMADKETKTIVTLFFFRKSHSFWAACEATHVSVATGKRRVKAFVRTVGKTAGF